MVVCGMSSRVSDEEAKRFRSSLVAKLPQIAVLTELRSRSRKRSAIIDQNISSVNIRHLQTVCSFVGNDISKLQVYVLYRSVIVH